MIGQKVIRSVQDANGNIIQKQPEGGPGRTRCMKCQCICTVQRLPDGKEAQPAGMLAAATNKGILLRMLRNLKAVYAQRKEWMKALRTAGHIIELAPAAADEYRDRAMIYLNLECARAALDDFQSYLKFAPHAKDARSVRATIAQLGTIASRLN